MVFSKKSKRKTKRKTKRNLQRKNLIKQSGGASLYEQIKSLNHSLSDRVFASFSKSKTPKIKHFYTDESFHDRVDDAENTEAYFKELNMHPTLKKEYNVAVAKKKPTQTANTLNGLELTELTELTLKHEPTITHKQYIEDITLRPYYKHEHYYTLLPDEDLQEKYDTFKNLLVYTNPIATITLDQLELFIDPDFHKLWQSYKRSNNTYKYRHKPYFIDDVLFNELSKGFAHKTKNLMTLFTGNILKRDGSPNEKMLYFIPLLFNEELITVQLLIMQNQTIMDYEYTILDHNQKRLFVKNRENTEQYTKREREQPAKQSVKLTSMQSEIILDLKQLLNPKKKTINKEEYTYLTVPFPKIKEFITENKPNEEWTLTNKPGISEYLESIMPSELQKVIIKNPFTIYDITTDDNILKNLGLDLESASAAAAE